MIPVGWSIPVAIVSIIGLLMNSFICGAVLLTKQISANNILLIHLGVVESVLCLLYLAFALPSVVRPGEWIAAIDFLCSCHGFLITLLHPMALWTICGLNCDRFYAIAAPLHYSAIVNTKKVVIGLGCGWAIATFLCIPPLVRVAPYHYIPDLGACAPDFFTPNSLWYAILYTIFTLIIPGVLIIGSNIKVLMIARYHRHRIASAIYQVTLSAQVTITHQRNPFFIPSPIMPPKFRSRSPVCSMLQLIGSFVILYSPYYVTIMWQSSLQVVPSIEAPPIFPSQPFNEYFMWIASTLLTCSCPINSLLYGVKSKTIRKTFQNYWRKKRTKCEINNEIQARTPSTCGSRRPSISAGIFQKPTLQRRLSETFFDLGNVRDKPKIKRIASELAWRPINITFASLDRPSTNPQITASCNTLQVPNSDAEPATLEDRELYLSLKNSFRMAMKMENPRHVVNFQLNKKPRKATPADSSRQVQLFEAIPLKSPKILITRAFSEDSDKSQPNTPAKCLAKIHRKYSSSGTLPDGIPSKWKPQSSKESDSESESTRAACTVSSNSTTVSEMSRRYSSLEEHSCSVKSEEQQLLLSWPTTRKKYQQGNRQRKFDEQNGGQQEVIL